MALVFNLKNVTLRELFSGRRGNVIGIELLGDSQILIARRRSLIIIWCSFSGDVFI